MPSLLRGAPLVEGGNTQVVADQATVHYGGGSTQRQSGREELRTEREVKAHATHSSGGWRVGCGRGGGWAGDRSDDKSAAASAAAMDATNGAGAEGQQGGEEGSTDEQLSAAGNNRGGQGGRRPPWSAEKEKLFREGKCFYCKGDRHPNDICPKKDRKSTRLNSVTL